MAKLKTILDKDAHEALDEQTREFYNDGGDHYYLDVEGIDDHPVVSGLKKKNQELLSQLKRLKSFDGLDPDEVRAALDSMAKQSDKKLIDREKFDELLAKKQQEFEARFGEIETRYKQTFRAVAEKELQAALVRSGVKPGLARGLALEIQGDIQAVDEGGAVVWRTADGIETVDLGRFVDGLKSTRGDYFGSVGAVGSGAAGGNGNGAGHVRTLKLSEWEKLSPAESTAFFAAGGKIAD